MIPQLLLTMYLKGNLFPLRMDSHSKTMPFRVSWSTYCFAFFLRLMIQRLESNGDAPNSNMRSWISYHKVYNDESLCLLVRTKNKKSPQIFLLILIVIFVDPKVNRLAFNSQMVPLCDAYIILNLFLSFYQNPQIIQGKNAPTSSHTNSKMDFYHNP